jgi:flavin-dependent dehydrogenase
MIECDVTILGGGIAGLATAIALRKIGFSVTIVERGNYDQRRVGETLPPEARIPLMTLGVWDDFGALGFAQSPARLSAWGSDRLNVTDHVFNAYGGGWLITRPRFDQMLSAAATRCGVMLLRKARVHSYRRRDAESWDFVVSKEGANQVIHSGFVVIATGRASCVLRRSDDARSACGQLVGIISRVAPPTHWSLDDHRLLVETTPDGWWYSLRFPDGDVELGFMSDSDLVRGEARRFGSRTAMLASLLNHAPHTCQRLGGRLNFRAAPKIVSANTYSSKRPVDDAKLMVGDAAVAMDPLSGQGSFAALTGGIRAAAAIAAHSCLGAEALESYEDQERWRFNQILAALSSYYRMERRWPDPPFWRRRQETGPTSRRLSWSELPA